MMAQWMALPEETQKEWKMKAHGDKDHDDKDMDIDDMYALFCF